MIWAPWRMKYIQEEQGADCFFCSYIGQKKDAKNLILHRGETCFTILNRYPYNAGHLLVLPYRHVATYDAATAEEVAEIASLTQTAMRVLRETSRTDGFNIGMNQGAIAGAGIAAHLHQHVVPRWAADANFFPIIAQTKSIPRLLGEVRNELASAWPV